jgi:hypothetical protein
MKVNVNELCSVTRRAIEQYREVLVLELQAGTERETAIALARNSAVNKAREEFTLMEVDEE